MWGLRILRDRAAFKDKILPGKLSHFKVGRLAKFQNIAESISNLLQIGQVGFCLVSKHWKESFPENAGTRDTDVQSYETKVEMQEYR
jgi:hypothetical protein